MFEKRGDNQTTHLENLLKKREKTLSAISTLAFPALPPTVRTVLALCGSINSDAPEISRVIQYDFGMTLNVLRTINSAFYSADKTPVVSVLHAIVLLGMDVLAQTVLEMPRAKIDEFRIGPKRIPPPWIVLSSRKVFAAHLSIAFARYTDMDLEVVFYQALFRDLGEVILSFINQEGYNKFSQFFLRRRNRDLASREAFGLTFDELTKHLVTKWNLPKKLMDVVYLRRNVGRPTGHRRRTPQLIAHLANELVEGAGTPGLKGLRLQEDARKKLKDVCGISEKMVSTLVRQELKELERNSSIYYETLKVTHFLDNLLI